MDKKIDIHKAAGVLIKDRKFPVTRSRGKNFFISPGGKLEAGESSQSALIRELNEELGIEVTETDLKEFGTFYAPAAGRENKHLQMDVYLVKDWKGEITPANEVEEVLWINSELPAGMELGSIFQHDVLPKLHNEGFID